MIIHILKETPNELRIEIEGESNFCNALQKTLLEDDKVDVAGYDMPHPLMPNTIFYIRTKDKRKPKTALKDAVKKIKERSDEFRSSIKLALKAFNEDET